MTVLTSDGFDSLHYLILRTAKESVGADWSTQPLPNMNGGMTEGMVGLGQR